MLRNCVPLSPPIFISLTVFLWSIYFYFSFVLNTKIIICRILRTVLLTSSVPFWRKVTIYYLVSFLHLVICVRRLFCLWNISSLLSSKFLGIYLYLNIFILFIFQWWQSYYDYFDCYTFWIDVVLISVTIYVYSLIYGIIISYI